MKWWVCSQSDVDENRERFLAAVEGCYGYSLIFSLPFFACTFSLASDFI